MIKEKLRHRKLGGTVLFGGLLCGASVFASLSLSNVPTTGAKHSNSSPEIAQFTDAAGTTLRKRVESELTTHEFSGKSKKETQRIYNQAFNRLTKDFGGERSLEIAVALAEFSPEQSTAAAIAYLGDSCVAADQLQGELLRVIADEIAPEKQTPLMTQMTYSMVAAVPHFRTEMEQQMNEILPIIPAEIANFVDVAELNQELSTWLSERDADESSRISIADETANEEAARTVPVVAARDFVNSPGSGIDSSDQLEFNRNRSSHEEAKTAPQAFAQGDKIENPYQLGLQLSGSKPSSDLGSVSQTTRTVTDRKRDTASRNNFAATFEQSSSSSGRTFEQRAPASVRERNRDVSISRSAVAPPSSPPASIAQRRRTARAPEFAPQAGNPTPTKAAAPDRNLSIQSVADRRRITDITDSTYYAGLMPAGGPDYGPTTTVITAGDSGSTTTPGSAIDAVFNNATGQWDLFSQVEIGGPRIKIASGYDLTAKSGVGLVIYTFTGGTGPDPFFQPSDS